MKYAILAGIYANLEALRVVLQDMKVRGCTDAACLGDIVGYGANPKECLDLIRGMNIPCVKGNHDEYCSSGEPLTAFNPQAAKVIEWTRKQLTEEDRVWLHSLEHVKIVAGFTIVHATLDGPERWGYVFDRLAATASLTHQNTNVCFFGHTNVPVAFIRDSVVRGGTYSKFKIEPGRKYFVNVGAVGQPRDGDPRAAYVVYDLDEGTIELRRLDYDWPGAQGKVEALGFRPRGPSAPSQ
jgi:diadenosine tetraphosphatase ApaH/serine/threonine PP2A family protein phosphatase